MQYKVIDKELIDIRSLENITDIQISNILNPSYKSINTSLLGIIATADRKMYHYIQTDRYFEEYLKRLLEEYHKEKEEHPIKISKELIPIFEQQLSLPEEEEINHYLQLPGFKEQKIKYQRTKIDQIKKILFYELQSIKQVIDTEETYKGIIGYRNQFKLLGTKNKNEIEYPIRIESIDDFNHNIFIENFFSPGNGLEIRISFRGDKTSISWKNEISTLSGYHDIEFRKDNAYEVAAMYENGECIFIDSKYLTGEDIKEKETQEINNMLNLFNVKGDFKAIKLPWGDFHLQEEKEEVTEEEQEKKSLRNLDLVIDEKNSYLTYLQKTKVKSKKTGYLLAIDGRQSFHHALMKDLEDNYGIIETRFYHVPYAKSKYKLQLEDYYFYETFETEKNSFKELDEVEINPIEHLEEKDKGYQLLKRREMKKIEKRGEE